MNRGYSSMKLIDIILEILHVSIVTHSLIIDIDAFVCSNFVCTCITLYMHNTQIINYDQTFLKCSVALS